MNPPDHTVIARLRALTSSLGTNGGLMSPAVYDTARATSLLDTAPATRHHRLAWLLSQQHSDGGWGHPHASHARDLPTLAAILALHDHPAAHTSVRKAVDFLHQHAPRTWNSPLPEDLLVGVELTVPVLLDEAARRGIPLPAAYGPLRTLGEQRRRLIQAHAPHPPGSSAAYSWETWAPLDDPSMIDGTGGIGHSPAATATWIHHNHSSAPPLLLDRAQQYLHDAGTATGTAYLLPTAWPITVFERVWVLYALARAGLTQHPRLKDSCDHQLDRITASLTPDGLGFSDHFMVDGDITATALATLALTGRPTDAGVLDRFRTHDHYGTYPGELQNSVTTTAHALHALTATGTAPHQLPPEPVDFLLDHQNDQGRWDGDKWHTSWIYTTAQTLTALTAHPRAHHATHNALTCLVNAQNPDGSWGTNPIPTAGETGHAVLALHTAHAAATIPHLAEALHRAAAWLTQWHRGNTPCACGLWISKDLYCPTRIDEATALTALAALNSHD
ncbi:MULTISPECIES: prenyltransferase/squalene oxidase repeat-containing protein [Streptomyces]|uniref:prenyltransferase/squalene oxidase repeat-containing protein n=1 Tax=Streptomyces lycopersici TaxID=2974589 RepID=UPI0021CFB3AC|nr:prenyltransferase/squalene oxidase repeat-containing protein [Streptomyces sp. NEAU-383]